MSVCVNTYWFVSVGLINRDPLCGEFPIICVSGNLNNHAHLDTVPSNCGGGAENKGGVRDPFNQGT